MAKQFIHIFEEAGLGVAPFRIVEVTRGNDWNSCDYCATAIKEKCWIQDAKGKFFVVGNECVKKTGDSGLIDIVKRELNRLRREDRHEKEAAKIEEGKAILEGNSNLQTILSLKFHPYAYQAAAGKTLLDYVNWMIANAGNKGKLEAVAVIHKFKDVEATEADKTAFEAERARIRAEVEAEVEEAARAETARRERAIGNNQEILAVLRRQPSSGFIDSMISILENSPLSELSNRQFSILCDICARQDARRGSKKYKSEFERFEQMR